MRVTKLRLFAVLVVSGCASYTLPVPEEGFAPADDLPVQGGTGFNLKALSFGNYQVTVKRGSTRENVSEESVVKSAKSRQHYSFQVTETSDVRWLGDCELSASELAVGGLPGGIEVVPNESAELLCGIVTPQGAQWVLELKGKSNNDPMHGTLRGESSQYTVTGIGTAAFSNNKHGPTGGYWIRDGERTLATVQVVGKRSVSFASDADRNVLAGAAAALLLVDDQVRQLRD